MTTIASASIAPRPAPPAHLTEADLWHLWEGQRFPAGALKTTAGLSLRVIYRGRATAGAGPDFRDAIIAAPDGLLQGDVELHVRSGDFRRHGHATDSGYDNVALHVVFRHDGEGETELSCGRRVPVVALEDWTERRAREIQRWLLRGARYEEPCRSAVPRLGPDAAGAALDRLGDMRLRAKAAAMARSITARGADGALWHGALEALGYGGSGPAFAAVAAAAPWERLAVTLEELPARQRPAAAEYLLLSALAGVPEALSPGAVRPANRPERRLRGAAAIAARLARGPAVTVSDTVGRGQEAAPGSLLALFTVPGAIGRGRAIEIVANAVLPFLVACGREREALALYARLPLPARYGNVRHLHEALSREVPLGARRQQGMLYLLGQYCTQGGCGKCPLS